MAEYSELLALCDLQQEELEQLREVKRLALACLDGRALSIINENIRLMAENKQLREEMGRHD